MQICKCIAYGVLIAAALVGFDLEMLLDLVVNERAVIILAVFL